jgi:hypothetical protein
MEENFRGQQIVPEAEKGGVFAALAEAALIHAHGLISLRVQRSHCQGPF